MVPRFHLPRRPRQTRDGVTAASPAAIRTAFVLGAGLGTRLRPLTARRPKPLVPVGGKPLIAHAFDHLLDAGLGLECFVVNTHWCPERYAEFFPGAQWRGIPIVFTSEQPEVLETAGGIWNAREHLRDGPFVVYNGDILSTLPLARAAAFHRASGAEVTLVLRSRGENRNVTFDPASGQILDLRRALLPEFEPAHLFTGIYFVEPAFIDRLPPGRKESVVPIFHAMIRAGVPIAGLVLDEGDWRDLGTRAEYLAACPGPWISPHARVAPDAVLENCQVWENAEVAPGAHLTRCVVTDGARAAGTHVDTDF